MATEQEERATTPAATTKQTSIRSGIFRVLSHRDFALFWVCNTVSLTGMWMQNFAQGWLVTDLTPKASALGFLTFVSAIPTLLLTPIGGVMADKHDRRRILIWTQWVMLAMAILMGLLVAADRLELWHVVAVAVLLGVVMAFDLPAYQAFYPALVPKEDLAQAISLNQSAFHGSRIIGPALAGVAVRYGGMATAFYANAASFLALIYALAVIRSRARPGTIPFPAGDDEGGGAVRGSREAKGRGSGSAGSMMREGFQYVRDRPRLQAMLGISGATSFFIFPNMAVLMPYYAQHVLKVGVKDLSTMMTVSGTGALLGAMLLLTVPASQRIGRLILSALTVLTTMSVLAWSQSVLVSCCAIAVQSLAISTSMGLVNIMIQESVPDEFRGRVMGLGSMMFTGVIPFAALIVGLVVDRIGMRRELQIAAVLYAVATLCTTWLIHTRDEHRAPSAE